MLQWMQEKFISILKIAITGIVLSLAIFSYADFSLAQSVADPGSSLQTGVAVIEQPLGLPSTDIRLVVAKIIRVALGLLGVVALALILYGGFLWMTAGGNEEQIGSAKKFLLNTAIGLAIILSAYAIVSFVISKLTDATTGGDLGGDTGGGVEMVLDNFQGSGALGQIIKDHYPAREQSNIPRNTRIVVSFRRPIKMDSLVEDTSGDGVFGNCKTTVENWYNDCDRVKNINDSLVNIKRVDTGDKIFGAVALGAVSTENGVTGVYTITIKPITDQSNPAGGYLGSPTESVAYTVRLGSDILLDDPANNNPSIFSAGIIGNNYYQWGFSNGTALDISPPVVENVFPDPNSVEDKNSVLQINFSEPLDPIGITGKFNVAADHYYVDGQNIFLKSDNSSVPVGNFSLTNGYKTLEFTPSQECGKNSCGNKVFCLPVCDKPGADCTRDQYQVLLRAAKTISPNSFEAQPFSGVTDLSGNALDGNKNNIPNSATGTLPIFPNQKQPDNYFWSFSISNQIDMSAPFIQTITPGIDAENIRSDQELSMVFNKKMRIDSMYSIGIEEKPAHAVPIWRVPASAVRSDGTTYTRLNHGSFIDSSRQYYFTVVSSTVEDLHFNCFYPGKGPRMSVFPNTTISPSCQDDSPQNCCQVVTEQNKAFCCNGVVGEGISACLNALGQSSI